MTAGTSLPDPPPTLYWQAIAMPGKTPARGAAQPPLRGGQIKVSGTFAQQLQTVLSGDSTLAITDEALRYVPPAVPAAPQPDATTVTTPLPPVPQSPTVKP